MFIISKLVQRKRIIRQLNRDDPEHKEKEGQIRKSLSFTVPEQLHGLTPLEAKALRLTWTRLNEGQTANTRALKMMTIIFQRLSDENKSVRDAFFMYAFIQGMKQKRALKMVTIRDHARCLCVTVNRIIESIEPFYIQKPTVTSLKRVKNSNIRIMDPFHKGRCHDMLKPYGLNPDVWERFGEIFIDQIFLQDCVRAYPGASKAWTRLIAMLTDELRAGYEQRTCNDNSFYLLALEKSLSSPARIGCPSTAVRKRGCDVYGRRITLTQTM